MRLLTCLSFLFFIHASNAQSIVYVDANASGAKDGSSWSDAYDNLDSALMNYTSGDSIFVRNGVYYPSGSGTSSTFTLPDGVLLYGGFKGNETGTTQRELDSMNTILDGNIGNKSINTDNASHILWVYRTNLNVVIDGFIIQNGYGIDNFYGNAGGGIFIKDGQKKVYIVNCIFRNNYAQDQGAAIYMNSSFDAKTLDLNNCQFIDNKTNPAYAGGGGAIFAATYVRMYACTFTGNVSQRGGAVLFSSSSSIDRCRFDGNSAEGIGNYGGALYASKKPTIYNSIFVGNFADNSGAAIFVPFINSDGVSLISCTVADNYCNQDTTGVAIFAQKIFCQNSIVYGNRGARQMYEYSGANSPLIWNTICQDKETNSTNSYTTDPKFIKPGKAANSPFAMTNYNYGLDFNSVGLNGGDNKFVYSQYPDDLFGNQRIYGTSVDIGAIENLYETVEITLENLVPKAGNVTGGGTRLKDSLTTITATPAGCFRFSYWTERDTFISSDSMFSFYATHSRKFRAHFDQDSFTLNVASSDAGQGKVTGGGYRGCGEMVTIKATSEPCYKFDHWKLNGQVYSTLSQTQIELTSDMNAVAYFVKLQFVLNLKANPTAGGVVSGSGTFNCDSIVPVSASANPNFVFVNWTSGTQEVSTIEQINFKVTGNQTLTANFSLVGAVGDISGEGITIYPNPATSEFTIEGLSQQLVDIRIYDEKGVLVGQPDSEEKVVDVSNLSAGVYTLRVVTGSNSYVARLVIE